MREEYFTNGKITVRGDIVSEGSRKRVDCLLFHQNIPIALIETKSNKYSVGHGIQQAIGYAETLDVPFAYSSNGDGFLEHNRTSIGEKETELKLDEFPSPQDLWERYRKWKDINDEQEEIITQKYYSDYKSGKTPRYYQRIAVNRTVEAIAKGKKRVLLVMATGTGKTYVAFQIIWRLWKSRVKKRILFLADRKILINQTRNNDFRPFNDVMTKITSRKVDTAYEVYLALYQGISGNEEKRNIYKQFSPDFFDLIVVDECHRGSAAEDSVWREILEYYSSATQIGLTATPKKTKKVSNIDFIL